MRFANPPGLASFMAKNAGYDQIGSQGIKESAETDLTTMGTMGQAQANALNTIAKNEAAKEYRDARIFGMAKKADAEFFGSVASAVGTIGGSAIKGGLFNKPTPGTPKPTTPPRTMPDAPTQTGLGLSLDGIGDTNIGYPNAA